MSKTKIITKNAIIATIYVVLSLFFHFLSFGAIQFRFAEILNLLVFFNKKLVFGVVIGCFITNLFSEFMIYDITIGTTLTFMAVYCISKTKNFMLASLWPTFYCGFIGIMISYLANLDLISTVATVMLGEFIVVSIIGYPILTVLSKNENFIKLLKD